VCEPPTESEAVARQDSYHTISEWNKLPILGTSSADVAFACAKDMAMSTGTRPYSIVTFQDGSVAVVRSDPRTPRLLEVIAIFSDAPRVPETTPTEKTAGLPNPQVSRSRPRHNGVSNQLRKHRN
jgi:hypothetical protein